MSLGAMKTIGLLLAMLGFALICWWAYAPSNRKRFDEDAMLPFVDEKKSGRINHE